MAELIAVTVAFSAAPGHEEVVDVLVRPDASVQHAIATSGLHLRYPLVDFEALRPGIWGKLVARDAQVRANDRIEIYRPLVVDPKLARSRRAAKKIKPKPASDK